ncbi:MAG: hypothetical protein HYU64_14825 [Armatimonadetes bacterium]|nr:hypothetical protein [Armatimonadota bacterium]
MELLLAGVGSYPRIGDDPSLQNLRRVTDQWEKGQRTREEVRRATEEATRLAIQEQIEAGLDLVTDGLIAWHDPVSHVAGKLEGIAINGLLRYFDTNFYFRQPEVKEPVRWKEPLLKDEFLFASQISEKPVKPVLTGPYTLARLTILSCDHYKNLKSLVLDYAQALKKELEILALAGASSVQIDEPAILRHSEDWEMFREAFDVLSKDTRLSLILHVYFGDPAPLYESFQELPVEVLSFDFSYSATLKDKIASLGSEKPLGLGLIDGRNTRMETETEVLGALHKLVPKIRAPFSYLCPSCGLEFLPRDRARGKLAAMALFRKSLGNGGTP